MADNRFSTSPMTRRHMLGRAAMLVAGAAGSSALISACGDDARPSAGTPSGAPAPWQLRVGRVLELPWLDRFEQSLRLPQAVP